MCLLRFLPAKEMEGFLWCEEVLWDGLGAMFGHKANVWRSFLPTLLVDVGCGGVMGLLTGCDG